MKELIFSSEHFGFVLSIFIFLLSIQIKVKFKSELLNPLLLSTIIIGAILVLFRIPYKEYQKGAGLLSYFLTPATVCLAIPLYKQISLLKNNFIAVFFSILLGTLTSLGSILLLGLLFRLKAEHIFTLLPKSITTAIGIDLIFRILPIRHPIAKGLALGTGAHAIGTAKALDYGEVEGAMSSLAIVLAGIFTVIFVPIITAVFF